MLSRRVPRHIACLLTRGIAPLAAVLLASLVLGGASAARALPLEISTTSLASGTAGVPYSDAVVATSGTTPYAWSLASGALPGGVVLDGATGQLSGTATLAGTSDFIVLVTDAVGDTATRALSITVAPAAVSALSFSVQPTDVLVTATIAPAVQVLAVDAFGNPVPGESVSLALIGTGTLSGGSAVLTDGAGIATFAALSVDHAGSAQLSASAGALSPVASAAFTVSCPAITLLPAGLAPAQLGAAYSQALSATGGLGPYAFTLTAGALPSGLTLSGAGVLSGTPLAAGTASFTVTATGTGDCAGSLAYALEVQGVPAAVADLAVARETSGNDGDGTSRMRVTFTPSAFTASAEVYRAPFGGYPRYDDAGGAVPPTPSYPPGAPWALTPVTASGQTDEPAGRDAWSYVVFLKNSFGQVSSVSNKTAPTPNYALGDVSNGLAPGAGDNLVNDADISLLGAHYGISGATLTSDAVHYLDVGPTTDLAVTSRPFTDDRIDFEDLIVFATNYGAVSAPAQVVAGADAALRAAQGPERLTVSAPILVEAGATFSAVVRLQAAGRIQGLSAELAWDAAVADPVSVTSAGWVEAQNGVLLSARPGTFDAALLGVRASGLAGEGELARVTYRARRTGDPQLRLARVLARDAANRALGESALSFGRDAGIPARTLLLAPSPNPSRGDAGVSFALAHSGDVELAIYSVDGRRVRVLARGVFAAGSYRFTWNGADEQQRPVAPGVYFAQLVAGGKRFSHTVVRLH